MVKNLSTNAGGAGSFPIWEDPLEKEMATPLQYSCPGNPMDRGGWRVTAHEVAGVRHNLATRAVVRKFGHP